MTLAIMPGKVPFVRQKCIYISFRSMRSAVSANALPLPGNISVVASDSELILASRKAEKVYNDSLTVDLIIMDKFDANRRRLLALGALRWVLPPFSLRRHLPPSPTPRPRILTLNNLHTGESLRAEFFDGRGYIQDELARLNHFFRDYRANKIKSIDPNLFDHLYRLQGLLGTNKPVQLISGYRSLDTNDELRARSRGVAKHSYHTKGQAMDFHIEGISLSNIRKAALSMRAGGVGYYPRSNFVHIDTGPVRHW
ncbi:Tat (twin-arginine translocation) pathway signal sequence domain/peptidase M15 family protein [Klebsiella pneumoniae]|uniref:Murein endopeptidase K n=9 Tax=Bacteria TaxID=2 RepID=A0A2X3EQV0_KLEPN|nr:Tat (twin-arginine translocation) pathway signal sequence domain/peptidase M15 family protein [Klebsiella pneumoniae]